MAILTSSETPTTCAGLKAPKEPVGMVRACVLAFNEGSFLSGTQLLRSWGTSAPRATPRRVRLKESLSCPSVGWSGFSL